MTDYIVAHTEDIWNPKRDMDSMLEAVTDAHTELKELRKYLCVGRKIKKEDRKIIVLERTVKEQDPLTVHLDGRDQKCFRLKKDFVIIWIT